MRNVRSVLRKGDGIGLPASTPTGPGSIVVSNAGSGHTYAAKSDTVSCRSALLQQRGTANRLQALR